MERTENSQTFTFGNKIPEFVLPGTDGKNYSHDYFTNSQAGLVIFTCNHCPYVKGSEKLMNQTIVRYQQMGLKVLAISANDASQYPDDSFELMKNKQLPYPYLYDETQQVAKAFDAACTPECYLFDAQQQLVFHGTINDSPRDASKATKNFLTTAIEQVLSGQEVQPRFVHPIGCSIKWKN